MKNNYHTHTTRCFHAVGQDEDYVRAAIDGGFDLLGFADHAPWPFESGFVSNIRMGMDALPGYLASVRDLQERYADRLPILLGLESEYFPRYHDHLLRMRDMGVSYYILGQHYADSEEDTPYTGLECRSDEGVLRYAESTVKAIRTGLFIYVAHPDLFMRHRTDDQFTPACMEAADMICLAAKEQGMPIEYNLLGLGNLLSGHSRGYPSDPFWQYARKYDNDVILGVDAHDPAHLRDTALWQAAVDRVQAMGYHLVESLVIPE